MPQGAPCSQICASEPFHRPPFRPLRKLLHVRKMAAAVPGESAPSGSESGDLFDPLPTAEGERYYAALRTRLPPAYQGFAVQFDEATGQKRMLASRPVPKGDTVLFDVPLVSMQTYKNKVCSKSPSFCCLASLGSPSHLPAQTVAQCCDHVRERRQPVPS